MKNKGVTLIELLVVIAIVSILVIALGFAYQGWVGRYRVESNIKEIYSDLMTARTMAMTRHREYFVDFPTATTYRVSEDDSDGANQVADGDGVFQPQANPLLPANNTDNTLPTFPKTILNPVTWVGGTITFETTGSIATPNILLDPANNSDVLCVFTDFDLDAANASDFDPDYDCIIIARTRINIGKLTTQNTAGGLCNAANCNAR